jgi:hypothetical protein
VQPRWRGLQVPGWSAPQPSPSHTPELHSAPSRQLAPSAFEPLVAVVGSGVVLVGVGVVGSGSIAPLSIGGDREPGSLVAGGLLSVGAGGGALTLGELEHATRTNAMTMERTMVAS